MAYIRYLGLGCILGLGIGVVRGILVAILRDTCKSYDPDEPPALVWVPLSRPTAPRHAPSEIVEPVRNLGRFPPVRPRSVRHRIPPNQMFSRGGVPVATREA